MRSVPVKPGDIIRQRFRVDALIGRGGMGHVFSATDLTSPLQGQVAIKVVSSLLVDKIVMARLLREAEAAQRIQSDFVPRVTEVSETDDGETFLVMDRLFGEPLSQRIRDNGVLPWPEIMAIGEDILRGLIDAHTAGIVHLDLKPSNVFLALKNGRVRAMVLDFGVCKVDGVDTERLTATGESIGTVAYMAPEQIRGASAVDERADLYAFGVVVFEMLCGRLPHEGASQMNILASKLEHEAPSVVEHSRVAMPDGVGEIVMRTLAKDPARRHATAQEVLKAWRGIGANRTYRSPGSHPPPARSSVPAPARSRPEDVTSSNAKTEISRPITNPASFAALEQNPTETSLAGSITPRQQSNARLALVLTAVSLFVGLGVVGFTVARGSSTPAPVTASAATAGPVDSAPETPAASASEDAADPIELPDDPATHASPGDHAKPRAKRTSRPRAAPPKITSQPRY